jgi:CRP-like cAMP-binding protein
MTTSRRSKAPAPANRPPPASRHPPPPAVAQNLLLAALPPDDYQRIGPSLEVIPLILKDVLQKPGEPIQHVYFPGGGFCSILTVLEDGSMVEVATVGREGMLGVSAILDGRQPVPSTTLVQAEADTCYRMPVEAFRHEMDRRGTFHELLAQYALAHLGFVMQSTACNAMHSIEQRLARWLLMARDRIGKDEFPLTQEFVAMMLGASRPTVTVVAGTLQRAGLITYYRGIVRILDREKLEEAACECYRATTELLKAVTANFRVQKSR